MGVEIDFNKFEDLKIYETIMDKDLFEQTE